MNRTIRNRLKFLCAGLYKDIVRFPAYVKAGVSFLLWLVIAAAALAATYIALCSIWVVVQMAVKALGIKGG